LVGRRVGLDRPWIPMVEVGSRVGAELPSYSGSIFIATGELLEDAVRPLNYG